ncbi:uncharacterized protein LOC135461452 [Liolophura sinensis]|uniref:uncharacterized protein LOC135461452 n=1 Tax=Liolophura sinensis TaxID=3198878 RepID=UPI0031582B89
MGLLRQFGLLLQRYLIIRKRQPVILVLEVLWPLLTFLVVAVVRQGALPVSKPNCHYAERALPNAGMLPFVQTYVCNMNNECQTEAGQEAARQRRENLTGLIDDLGPRLSNPNVTNALKSLRNATVFMKALDKNLKNQTWLSDYMENGIPIRELLRNPDELRRNLVTKNRYLEGDVFDTILNASLSFNGIVSYLGDFNGTAVLCNATKLKHYLYFEERADVEAVTRDLCTLNTTDLPELIQALQNHLDVVKIVKLLSRVSGNYTLRNGFNDMSLLLDLILNSSAVKDPHLFQMVDVLKSVPDWIEKFKALPESYTDVLKDIVMELDPIIKGLSKNNTVWAHIKEGLLMVNDFIQMFFGEKSVAVKQWFVDWSEVEELLRSANVSEDSIRSLMNVKVSLEQLTPYLLSKDAKDLKQLLCVRNGTAYIAVICDEKRINEAVMKEFVELISLSKFKGQALEALNSRIVPVEDLLKQGIHYLNMVLNIPHLMDTLGAVTSINLQDTLRALEMVLSGNTTEQNVIRMLSSSLGGLDRALNIPPYANVTRILMGIADTCLSALTEAITTFTEMENDLARFITGEVNLMPSVNELLALGPQATKSVLQAFTDPGKLQMLLNNIENLRAVYCDGDRLSWFLDMPRSQTLDGLQEIFCTDNVTEISHNLLAGLHLEELQHIFKKGMDEIDSYLQGLKDPRSSQFNVSELLWKSLTFYNSVKAAEQTAVNDWTLLVDNLTSINLHTEEWSHVWMDFRPQVWTAGFAVAVETWGPVLEESNLWPIVGRYFRVAEVVMEEYMDQMTAMTDLFGGNSAIGQITMDVMKYFPEMVGGVLSVAENPAFITQLVNAGNLSSVLCNPHQLKTMMTIPDYVPLDEMLTNICSLDLDQMMHQAMAIYNFMGPDMLRKIDALLKNDGGIGTARGFNWSRMVEDGYKLYKMVLDPLQYSGMISLIENISLSDLDQYLERFEHLDGQEFARLAAFVVSYGSQIDRMFGNNPTWKLAKSYILMVEQYLETFNKNGFELTVSDIFPNATKLNKLVKSVGGVIPDLMEALKNMLLHPYKLSEKLLSMNLANQTVCDGLMVSSLLDIENPASVQALEHELCSLDWLELSREMNGNPAQEHLNCVLVALYLGKPIPDVSLNWTRITQNVYTYVSILFSNQTMAFPDLQGYGVNLTAIQTRFEELENASRVFSNADKATELSAGLFPLMEMLANKDPSLAAVWKMEKIYIFIINQFIKLVNENLPRFQGKAEVNLLHFLDSEELDKIAMALSASPDLVHVLLDTLLDIMLDSSKAAKFGNVQELMRVCSDPVVFNYFFPESAHVQLDIRGTICNASLVNSTKLVQELENSIGGLSQMVQAISQVIQPNVKFSDIHVNMSEVSKNSDQFTAMIMKLVKNPPRIDLGLGMRWMNTSVWSSLLDTYGDKFLAAFQRYENMSYDDLFNLTLAIVEQQLIQLVVFPEFNEAMAILGYTAQQAIRAMETLLGKAEVNLLHFLDSEELDKIAMALSASPDLVHVLLDTLLDIMLDSSKAAKFGNVQELMRVCSDPVVFNYFFPESAHVQLDIRGTICNASLVNSTKLVQELENSIGGLSQMVQAISQVIQPNVKFSDIHVNMSEVSKNSDQFTAMIMKLVKNPPRIDLGLGMRWMNTSVWSSLLDTYGDKFLAAFQRYENMSYDDLFNLTLAIVEQQLMQLVVFPEFNEAMAILGHTAQRAIQAMETLLARNSTSLKGFLTDYPTIERVIELSNSLPQILATLTYTNSFNPLALSSMLQTVDSWHSFCAQNISRFIQNVPGLNFDISTFHSDLCDLNMTQLIAEGQAFMGTTDLMTSRPILNLTYDWASNVRTMQAAVQGSGKLLRLYLRVLEKPPLHLQMVFTWLNKTLWETTFGRLGQQLADPGTTLRMLEGLDQLTPILDNISRTDRFFGYVWKVQKIQTYVLNEVIKLANKNLPRLEGKVNLLDFFRSEELEKIATALKASPEIIKLLFDTFLDIMADPTKSSKFSDPQKLAQVCSDQGVFRNLFPAAITLQVDIQRVICNLTYINSTRLISELQDGVYGLSQMVQALTRVASQDEINMSYKAMSKNYELFVEILTNLSRSPPQVELGLGREWDNASRWNKLWTEFSEEFINISRRMEALGLEEVVTSLLPVLEKQFSPLYQSTEFTAVMASIDMYLASTLRVLEVMDANTTAELMTKWSEFPEVHKFYRLLDQVPYLLMSLLDPSAGNAVRLVTEAYATVKTFEEFCSVDFNLDTVFPGLPNTDNYSPDTFKQALCRVNYTVLGVEVMQFLGTHLPNYTAISETILIDNTTYHVFSGRLTYDVTVSDVISKLVKVVGAVQSLVQHPITFNAFPLLNGAVWDKWFVKMAAPYHYNNLQNLLDMALSLRPTLQSILTSPIGRDVSPSTLRGLEGLINFLSDFIKMLEVGKLPDVWKSYEKLPFFRNLVQLSNMAPDVLDVFLETLIDPVKGQRLMGLMANPNSTLETFCNLTMPKLDFIFVMPANSSMSLDTVQSLICSLEIFSLGSQLVNITNTEYKFISDLVLGSQKPTGQLLNITDFLNDLDYLQAALSNITHNPPNSRLFQQLNITDYFPFYSLFLEETWKPFFEKMSAKMTTNPASIFDMLKALKPVLGATLQNGDASQISVLIGLDGAMTYLTDYFTMLQEGKLADPWEVFRGAPSLQKMFTLLDQASEILEILIETMMSPTKSQTFMSLFAQHPRLVFQTFCSEPDVAVYFEKPPGSLVDLDAVRQAICSIKVEEIVEELDNSSLSTFNFVSRMQLPGNLTLDVDKFYQHLEEFQVAFNNLALNPPDAAKFTSAQLNILFPFMGLFDQQRWSQMFDRVYGRLASRAVDPSWYGEVYSEQLSQLLGMLPSEDQGLVRVMDIMMEIYGVILDKSLLVTGKTSFRLADLFPASPAIQQLANFLDSSPELVEMILSSVTTPQFANLYTMTLDQALREICQRPESYFTLSPESGKTVEELMSQFCTINLTALAREFEEELHLPSLIHMSSNMTFNLTSYILITVRLMNSTWTREPFPMLIFDRWTNQSFWNNVFTRYSQMISSPTQEIELLLKSVLPMILPANDSSFQAVAVVIEEVTRVINAKLTELTNGTLSLDTLFDDAPRVKRLLEESLGIAPDLLHALFSATISQPDKLLELVTTPDWKAGICGQPGALQAVFSLPATINSSEVQRVVCSVNETLLARDVIHMLGIDRIQTKLQQLHDGKLVINWEEVFAQSNQLYAAIARLIRHPPRIQFPVIDMQALDKLAQSILQNLNDPNSGLVNLVKVLNVLDKYLNGTEGWAFVTNYYRASEILLSYMNHIVGMLTQSGRKVDLASLFGGSPHLRRLLDLVFHLGPDFLNGFLSASVKPEMIASLATGKFDPATQLCSESDMRRYFSFHPSFNLTYAIAALCQFNSSQVLAELSNLFDIRTLGDQLAGIGQDGEKFDPLDYIRQMQEFSTNLVRLFKTTGFTFDSVDVIKYMQFNGSMDALLQNSLLMAISKNATSFAEQLQLMMPLIEKTEFWKAVRPMLNAVNILTDVLNRKLTVIETQPITLENLLKNATHIRQLMEKGFELAPDFVSSILQSTANTTAYLSLVSSIADIPDFSNMTYDELMNYTFPTLITETENFCLLDMVILPPWVNTTAMRSVVCTVNATILLHELKQQISFDKIMAELAKIGQNISEPFSWRQFLTNIQTLQVKLGQLPKVNINVPVFPDFLAALFSYHGDMEGWLTRLERGAFNSPYGFLDGLKGFLHSVLSSVWVGAVTERSTPNETVVQLMTAIGKLLTLMEGQVKAVETVNLRTLFKYSEVSADPHALLSGDAAVIDKFLDVNFRPGKWAELRNTSSKDVLLCGNVSHPDQVFELPPDVDPRLLATINTVFCDRSSPAYTQFQDAIRTYDSNGYMVDVLSQVIGSPVYNSTENYASVVEKTIDLLDLILPWQSQRGHGLSPALTQLQTFWQKQAPRFNAKLYAAGVNILLSLLERGSVAAADWSRAGDGVRQIVEFVTSTLHTLTGDPVDLSRLFRDNSALVRYINTTLSSSTTFMQAMLQGKIKLDKLLPLLSRPNGQRELCEKRMFEQVFMSDVNTTQEDMYTAICQNTSQLFHGLAQILNIDVGDFMAKLVRLFNSSLPPPVVDWEGLYLKTDTLVGMVTDLASQDPLAFLETLVQQWTGSQNNLLQILDRLQHGDHELLSNLVMMWGQILGRADFNRYLYPLFQYLDGPILQQVAQQAKMFRDLVDGSAMDALAAFVNMDKLAKEQVRGMASLTLIQDTVCNVEKLGQVLPKQYENASVVSRALCGQPADSWYDNLASLGMGPLDVITLSSVLQGYFFTHAFNASGQNPPLSSLDWSKFGQHLQGLLTDLGMPISYTGGTWQSVLTQVGMGSLQSLISVVDILRFADPFIPPQYLNDAKQYIQAISNVFSVTNDLLDHLTASNSSLKLIKLYSEGDKAKAMIRSLLGEELAAQFLTASVNAGQLLTMVQAGSLRFTVCDQASFKKSFQFEAGVNSSVLRVHLCEAAKSNASLADRLVELLDVQSVVQEGMKMQGPLRNHTVLTGWELWNYAKLQLQRLKDKLGQLWRTYAVETDSPDKGMRAIGHILLGLSTNSHMYSQSCQTVLSLLGSHGTQVKPVLSKVMTSLQLLQEEVKVTEDFDQIVCSLRGMKLHEIVRKLADINVFGLIDMYVNMNSHNEPFTCDSMGQLLSQLLTSNRSLPGLFGEDFQHTRKCLWELLEPSSEAIKNIDSIFGLMSEVLGILDDNNLALLGSALNSYLKPVIPYIELFFKAALGQQEVVMSLSSLLKNPTQVTEDLVDVLQISPQIIQNLFNSTLNLDIVRILNNSADAIKNILCESDELSKYLTLPKDVDLTVETLSMELCNQNLTDAIRIVQSALDVGRIAFELSKVSLGSVDVNWYRGLATHISGLMTNIQGLSEVFKVFTASKVNWDEALPELQRILKTKKPEQVINSVDLIIQDFQAVTSDPEGNMVFNTLRLVNKGLVASDLFSLLFIPDIKDMITDPDSFRRYMINDLHFTPEVADAILTAEMSVMSKDLVHNLTEIVCDYEKLEKILVLDERRVPGITVQNVSEALCSLDTEELANVTQIAFKALDLGDILRQILSVSLDHLLADSGLDIKEMEGVFKELQDVEDDLREMSEKMKEISAEFNLTRVIPSPQALTSSSGINIMSTLLCGNSLGIRDEFQLSGIVQNDDDDDSAQSLVMENDEPSSEQDVDKGLSENEMREISAMPTVFCQDLLRTVYKSTGSVGSILWTYLKPLLRGKILYCPTTTHSQTIIKKANATFEMLYNVNRLAHDWAGGSEDLRTFVLTVKRQDIFMSLLSSPEVSSMIEQSLGVSGASVSKNLEQLTSMSEEQLDIFHSVANLLANLTDCLNFDRFEGQDTASEMFRRSEELTRSKEMMAAVEFEFIDSEVKRKKRAEPTNAMPKNVVYKIRMDLDNVPTTTFLKRPVWRPVPEDNFADDLRYLRGFVQLQEMIDRAVIEIHTGDNGSFPATYLQQFPFPCHEQDLFLHYLSYYLLPLMMTLAWIGSLGIAIKILLYDRETGIEETLKVMGLKSGVNWLAWLLITMLFMMLVAGLEVLILKVSSILRFSNWVILLVLIADFCFSSLMMCYMVSAFFTRANMAALTSLIVYLLSYLPFVMVTALEHEMTFTEKMLSCLSSTSAFGFACQFMSRFEEQLVGIQWHNTWLNTVEGHDMNFAWTCIMMAVDGVIYLIIGWYVRNVIPRKYGVPLPWYFPVSPRYWGCGSSPKTKLRATRGRDNGLSTDRHLIEHTHQVNQQDVGISLQNLTKIYSRTPAVHHLFADFYKGQITSLLGHNGAGKTTTINMLTGVIRPTHGTAFVNGLDIYTSLDKIRRDVGICPQYNTLFDFMTVKEHLELFIGLKGNFTGKSAKDEIHRMLDCIDLYDQRYVPVRQLSGGMKRRLCVALAFVGGSDMVILDEPTSGVDPSARRGVWDVILHNRSNRTILLSTHHLDEADILSDRIAILHDGRLLCCGSSMFLKKQLGSGYHLTAISDPESSSQSSSSAKESDVSDTTSSLMQVIRKYIPGAEVQEEMGTEVKVSLLATDVEKQNFQRMFTELDERLPELGIMSYGVSGETTLEEVFLKACYLADHGKSFTSENLRTSITDNHLRSSFALSSNKSSHSVTSDLPTLVHDSNRVKRYYGLGLKLQHFKALWLKRFHHYRRDWRLLFTLIILPMIFVAAGMGFALIQRSLDNTPPLVLTPAVYGEGQFAFLKKDVRTEMFDKMSESMTGKPGFGTTCMPAMRKHTYIKEDFQCVANPDDHYLAGVKGDKPVKCECVDFRYECDGEPDRPPQRLTQTGIILQNLSDVNIEKYLLDSFPHFRHNRYGGWSYEDGDKAKVWYNNKGHHAMPAYLNTLSNTILRSRLQPTEYPEEYGITTINHPYTLTDTPLRRDSVMQKAGETGIAMVILLAFSFIVASFVIYVVDERIRKEKRLQHISGVTALTYWSVAFVWDMMIFALTVGLAVGIMAIFRIPSYWDRDNLPAVVILLLLFGASTTNMMYMTTKLFHTAATAYMTLFCVNMLIGLITSLTVFLLSFFTQYQVISQVYDIVKYVFMIFPQYCLGEGLVRITKNQLITSLFARFGEDVYKNPYSMEFLGWFYVAMAIQAVVFFIITLMTEIRTRPLFRNKRQKVNMLEEYDVKAERERVGKSRPSDHAVMASNLSKLYLRGLKKIIAVDNVSFAVQSGECFGLLGVNGAGKTTVFKMLIGDTDLSGGDAYLNGKSVQSLSGQQRQAMGYCPQSDALDDFVSGRELLYCHARLKGTTSYDAKQMISALSNSLYMASFLDQATKTYSGGMKRKLSLAIAVIGRPDVIYLDEPTAGMDPVNKRLVWNLILDLVKGGTSIILTSHSMAECDILCNRLAIMVNGRFVCMGSPQHLKHKFSEGYSVITKVKGPPSNAHVVVQFMVNTFPGTHLKDQHNGTLEFAIPLESAHLPNIFGHLERQKHNLAIEDYSVQQTTLDAVFLQFAKNQTDGITESPDGSVTETDFAVSTSKLQAHLALSGPFVNESHAFMNPQMMGMAELQPDQGYLSKNSQSSVSRHSSMRSEKGKINPLYPMLEVGDEVTHL